MRHRSPSVEPEKLYRNLLDVALGLSVGDRAVGFGWWTAAADEIEELADEYVIDADRLAYAAAALSPGLRWMATLEVLGMLLKANDEGLTDYPRGVGHMTFGYRGRDRAWAIITTSVDPRTVCHGPKVSAVAANLMGDLNAVAVDRHLIRAATQSNQSQVSPSTMAKIAEATRKASPFIHLMPAQLQAAIWVAGQ